MSLYGERSNFSVNLTVAMYPRGLQYETQKENLTPSTQ